MSKAITIEAKGISKKHCRSIKRGMFYGLQDIIHDVFNIDTYSANLRPEEFWAIENVSFSLSRGDCLGVIGPNGAGKSTLLKLLNGIFWPDQGEIKIYGRVGAIIEIGAGFHPMLTGRENIYINASILGLTNSETNKKLDDIIEFAELEEYIDVPIKQYSSGMYVRLGFSIAALAKPDILLVDEVLAVGDFGFQRKCISKMQEYITDGGCLVVVTHDMLALNSLCKQCLVLSHGNAVYLGDVANGADVYVRESTKSNLNPAKSYSLSTKEIRYGSRECEIRSLVFLNEGGVDDKNYSNVLISGEEAIAKLSVYANASIKKYYVGISVWDMSGQALFTMNTLGIQEDNNGIEAGMEKEYIFNFKCPLNAGRYLVGAGIYNPETGEYLDRRLKWKILSVFTHNETMGLLQIPYRISTNLLNS